jgi:hypothetical protein
VRLACQARQHGLDALRGRAPVVSLDDAAAHTGRRTQSGVNDLRGLYVNVRSRPTTAEHPKLDHAMPRSEVRVLTRARSVSGEVPAHAERPPDAHMTSTDPQEWRGKRPQRFLDELAPEPIIGAAFLGNCDAVRVAMEARTLELLALRVSAELECLYSWRGHCRIALDRILSYAEIAGVASGPTAFSGHDADVLWAVDAILDHGYLTSSARSALGDAALSITIATGTYRTVAGLMYDIQPEPDLSEIVGLETPGRARETYATLTHQDTHSGQPEAA